MGRRRKKPLEPGMHTNFYIPEDIDVKILEYINEQQNLSKTIINLIHEKIYGDKLIHTDKLDIEQYVKDLFDKYKEELRNEDSSKEGSKNKNDDDIKNKVLKSLDFSIGYEKEKE